MLKRDQPIFKSHGCFRIELAMLPCSCCEDNFLAAISDKRHGRGAAVVVMVVVIMVK
jgi:hypothetical protein